MTQHIFHFETELSDGPPELIFSNLLFTLVALKRDVMLSRDWLYTGTGNAFEAAEKSSRDADLQNELEALFNRQNQSPNKKATSIPATFLRITVQV